MQTEQTVQQKWVEVAVSLPVDQTFTYAVPGEMEGDLRLGQRVLVPFGPRKVTGHIVEIADEQKTKSLRPLKRLLEILDPEPFLDSKMLNFLTWVANYYHAPLGEVLKTATPTGISLESFQTVHITPMGEAAFDESNIETARDLVLQTLVEKGSQRIQAVRKMAGVSPGLLKKLCEENLIIIDQHLSSLRVKIRKERFVKVLPVMVERVLRGSKQKEIIKILEESGELRVSDLEERLKSKGVAGILSRLSEKGLVALEEREVFRDPLQDFSALSEEAIPENLTAAQVTALEQISASLRGSLAKTFLLHGVTGSGKTEVYLRAVLEARAQGKGAIILVPEISLTAQMVSRFKTRLGEPIAVLHSNLSDGERYDAWRRIARGELQIAIGARSALFAPFENLGLIIVDEEHESSFKQESGLLYHARDLAVKRGQIYGATVVLGSATPSLESYENARRERFSLLTLPERASSDRLPAVRIIDMTKAPLVYRAPNPKFAGRRAPIFSKDLLDAMEVRLVKKEQIILFLNRRGFAPFLLCTKCGKSVSCPHCEISLTVYAEKNRLSCHICEHREPMRGVCMTCEEATLHPMGFGTEAIEREISIHFPEAKIVRMDRDTTTKKGSHEVILRKVHDGEADILLGTQMVAKGHHFPNVTLVGVISADLSLHIPDFRSAERTFQLLTQVAGRAGRGEIPGEVLIQTFSPEHYAITCAQEHDFVRFFEMESAHRQALHYPPYTRLMAFRLTGSEQAASDKAITFFRHVMKDLLDKSSSDERALQILGPAPAPKSKLRDQFRYQVLIKSQDANALHRFAFQCRKLFATEERLKALRLQIDTDPSQLS